jgi:hypothetical protein
MKKYLLILLAVAALLIISASVAFAKSSNAAIVVKSDGDCFWFANGLAAQGRLVYVETQNGHWKLSCKADSFSGGPISQAQVFTSSSRDLLGTCSSPAGDTNKFIIVFTPNGETHFTCQGESVSYP